MSTDGERCSVGFCHDMVPAGPCAVHRSQQATSNKQQASKQRSLVILGGSDVQN